jgi:hypothetical protein
VRKYHEPLLGHVTKGWDLMSVSSREEWLSHAFEFPFWQSWSHFMYFGHPKRDRIYKVRVEDREVLAQMTKVLVHEGSWFGFPRIPDEFRSPVGWESADWIMRHIAVAILEGYNRLVNNGEDEIRPLKEILCDGLETLKAELSGRIEVFPPSW